MHSKYAAAVALCACFFGGPASEAATVEARAIWDTGNLHEYIFVAAPGISWENARSGARSRPGFDLATITNMEEQAFFDRLAPITDPFARWVGGRQLPVDEPVADRGWTWVTGEPFSFTNWNPGEPNDNLGPGSEQYLTITYLSGAVWNDDASLGNIGGYVAESLAPVPVPSALLLALTGFGALRLVSRRRRAGVNQSHADAQ
jgi:hypothetical protein